VNLRPGGKSWGSIDLGSERKDRFFRAGGGEAWLGTGVKCSFGSFEEYPHCPRGTRSRNDDWEIAQGRVPENRLKSFRGKKLYAAKKEGTYNKHQVTSPEGDVGLGEMLFGSRLVSKGMALDWVSFLGAKDKFEHLQVPSKTVRFLRLHRIARIDRGI